jgi:hypothetical protein
MELSSSPIYSASSRKLNPKELSKLLDQYGTKEVTKDDCMKMLENLNASVTQL